VFPDVLVKNYSCTQPLKMKALHSFKMSGNSNQVTARHIPQDLSPEQHRCGNLKSLKPCHKMNSSLFRSLETAGQSPLAACTKDVGVR
jgi:hypothetical protein